MLRSCCVVVLLLFAGLAWTQTTTALDSLEAACNAYAKSDTVKTGMLLNLSRGYLEKDASKSLEFAESAIALSGQLSNDFYLAEALQCKGAVYLIMARLSEALAVLERSRDLFEKVGRPAGIADVYRNMGIIYAYRSEFDKAVANMEKAAALYKARGDRQKEAVCMFNMGGIYLYANENEKAISVFEQVIPLYKANGAQNQLHNVYVNLGLAYSNLSNYPKALSYYQQSLKESELADDLATQAIALANMGTLYFYLNDVPRSFEYDHRALAIYTKTGNVVDAAMIRSNWASRYLNQGRPTEALEQGKKALEMLEQIGDQTSQAGCMSVIGSTYIKMNNYDSAWVYIRRSMDVAIKFEQKSLLAILFEHTATVYRAAPDDFLIKIGVQPETKLQKSEESLQKSLQFAKDAADIKAEATAFSNLSNLYETMDNYPKAYEAYKNYIVLRDSITGEDVKKQITRKEIQFEFDKKEAVLKLEQQLTLEQLTQQKLLSVQQQQALRLKEQALSLSNQEKDLQRLAYLKEKAEKQEKEQLLQLAEKDKQLQESQLGALLQEKALQLQTLAKKNALIGFLIAGLAAIVLAFWAFFLWQRQKQARKEAAIQAQFTQQLLENIETERGRIAIDLHDSVSHELLSLKQSLRSEQTAPEAGTKIDGIINGIRQISRNLHPVMLDKIGLRLSLETLCEQFMQHEKLFVSHDIDYRNTLPKPAELQVFRIVQEALTNALKYSGAEAVKVAVAYTADHLQVTIHDNGKGFDVPKTLNSGKAFGLHSLLQRGKAIGGKTDLRSGHDGTIVSVQIPFP